MVFFFFFYEWKKNDGILLYVGNILIYQNIILINKLNAELVNLMDKNCGSYV